MRDFVSAAPVGADRDGRPAPHTGATTRPNRHRALGLAIALLLVAAGAGAAAACPPAKPVRFEPGTEGAVLSGGVPRGLRDCYTLSLREGQRLSVTLAAGAEDNVVFQIYQPPWKLAGPPDDVTVTGTPLPGTAEGSDARRFNGRLPASGAYLIVVGTTRGGGSYRMTVTAR